MTANTEEKVEAIQLIQFLVHNSLSNRRNDDDDGDKFEQVE